MKLAVFSPHIGVPSETFIRQHMEELAPGQTCVVADRVLPESKRTWEFDGPMLVLQDSQAPNTVERIAGGIGRRLGSKRATPLGRVEAFLKEQQPEVALLEYFGEGLQYVPLLKSLGIRIYAHAFGWDVYRRLREPDILQLCQDAYPKIDGVILMSEHMAARVEEAGLHSPSTLIKPCGVEIAERTRPISEQDGKQVVAIGRAVPKKSPINMLDSFRRAQEVDPALRLDYVGSGPLLGSARDFVSALDVGAVTFHGVLPHKQAQAVLDGADIFLQHSQEDSDTGDCEGVPVIILEAMARGIPVVSTRHSGIPEVVVDGETGILVDEGDTRAMAEAIVRLSEDSELRQRMGIAGREAVKERFSSEQEMTALREFLELSD